MNYILKTNNLTKQYGRQKAVNCVNMNVKQGDIYGFIGRNGAGKTTFLKMIAGMASLTDGEIEIYGKKGRDINSVRSRIGCLIEAPGLYPNMTAYDNLKIKCIVSGIRDKSYIENILKLVGLENVGRKKVKNFSLGMKQRLGIGLALVGDPDILLLDEPINGLDPQGIAEVRETIQRLNSERNITIIISSHILEELSKIATVYGIIHKGELIRELTNEELLEECKERIAITLEAPEKAVPVLDRMGFTKYKTVDSRTIEIYERLDSIPDIIIQLSAEGIRILSINTKTEAIEDYFLNLTGGKHNG
ncbi:MAG: ATP-binding cassette domain-containing protein [Ruminococcus sp.]|nr:ATP-binding cassette domain-containing protein [Ruminococcus sp.]